MIPFPGCDAIVCAGNVRDRLAERGPHSAVAVAMADNEEEREQLFRGQTCARYFAMGAISVRFRVKAARLLVVAADLNSSNLASSSALRKALLRAAVR